MLHVFWGCSIVVCPCIHLTLVFGTSPSGVRARLCWCIGAPIPGLRASSSGQVSEAAILPPLATPLPWHVVRPAPLTVVHSVGFGERRTTAPGTGGDTKCAPLAVNVGTDRCLAHAVGGSGGGGLAVMRCGVRMALAGPTEQLAVPRLLPMWTSCSARRLSTQGVPACAARALASACRRRRLQLRSAAAARLGTATC